MAFKYDRPLLSEAAQLDFFDAVMERSTRAAERLGGHVHWIELAGVRIELVFAGEAMQPHILSALAHRSVERRGEPDFRIFVWDSETSGVGFVMPPVPWDCFTSRGDLWGMNSRRVRSAFHWIEFSVNVLDLERRAGAFWVRSAPQIGNWTRGSPLRTLLHWCMDARGRQLIHGAAIGDDRGALLITGRGGIGKSTTALACLTAGMRYLGDDYVIVGLDPEPRVHSLYCAAKLARGQLGQFPELSSLVGPGDYLDDGKALLRLFPRFDDRISASLPLCAVVTTNFAGTDETRFAAARRADVLQAAAITTMSQLPHAGPTTRARIQRMVEAVPVGTLQLGKAMRRVPEAIRTALRAKGGSFLPPSPVSPGSIARPLVSVIIPVHNGAKYIAEAIRSIVAQAYDALEIIVVDDGSTDETAAVVADLGEDIRYLRQENAGPAAARNHGIREASGDLVAFLDADDLWPEGSLARLVERLLDDSETDVVHGHAELFRDTSDGLAELVNPGEVFPYYIGAGLYRRSAFQRVGLFEERLRFSEDSEWYTRAADLGLRIHRLDDVTLRVRRHEENMTRGKTFEDLDILRVVKMRIDRKRALAKAHPRDAGGGPGDPSAGSEAASPTRPKGEILPDPEPPP